MARTLRLLRRLLPAVLVLGAVSLAVSPVARATPPSIPSESEARSLLAGLRVAASGSMTGYSRDRFPHWNTVSGTCNVREVVLQRDGTGVRTDSSCAAVAGRWYSPYEGGTYPAASGIDIDHLVPLANAGRSGASTWTEGRRNAFANDLDGLQLLAVKDTVNSAKGDQSPDQWKPPLASFHCTYAKSWIDVKSYWGLSLTSTEKSALGGMINTC